MSKTAITDRGARSSSPRAALTRAAGGALLFSLPLLMTMEMWWLGFYMNRLRIAVFLIAFFPMLVALSYISGFEETFDIRNDVIDALVAFAVASFISLVTLMVLGVLSFGMPVDEIVGKVVLQAVPGSIGALLAQSQLGNDEKPERPQRGNQYLLEVITMAGGALFLAFNVAPTEEIQMIAHGLSGFQLVMVITFSVVCMHGFVYAADFQGQETLPEEHSWFTGVLRNTVVGYAVAFILSGFVLWAFGRFDYLWWGEALRETAVLAFPASVGAAAARLIL